MVGERSKALVSIFRVDKMPKQNGESRIFAMLTGSLPLFTALAATQRLDCVLTQPILCRDWLTHTLALRAFLRHSGQVLPKELQSLPSPPTSHQNTTFHRITPIHPANQSRWPPLRPARRSRRRSGPRARVCVAILLLSIASISTLSRIEFCGSPCRRRRQHRLRPPSPMSLAKLSIEESLQQSPLNEQSSLT